MSSGSGFLPWSNNILGYSSSVRKEALRVNETAGVVLEDCQTSTLYSWEFQRDIEQVSVSSYCFINVLRNDRQRTSVVEVHNRALRCGSAALLSAAPNSGENV